MGKKEHDLHIHMQTVGISKYKLIRFELSCTSILKIKKKAITIRTRHIFGQRFLVQQNMQETTYGLFKLLYISLFL